VFTRSLRQPAGAAGAPVAARSLVGRKPPAAVWFPQ